jgi:hypothetical protein
VGAEKLENWKTELPKIRIPEINAPETRTTVEFAQFFQFLQFS